MVGTEVKTRLVQGVDRISPRQKYGEFYRELSDDYPDNGTWPKPSQQVCLDVAAKAGLGDVAAGDFFRLCRESGVVEVITVKRPNSVRYLIDRKAALAFGLITLAKTEYVRRNARKHLGEIITRAQALAPDEIAPAIHNPTLVEERDNTLTLKPISNRAAYEEITTDRLPTRRKPLTTIEELKKLPRSSLREIQIEVHTLEKALFFDKKNIARGLIRLVEENCSVDSCYSLKPFPADVAYLMVAIWASKYQILPELNAYFEKMVATGFIRIGLFIIEELKRTNSKNINELYEKLTQTSSPN